MKTKKEQIVAVDEAIMLLATTYTVDTTGKRTGKLTAILIDGCHVKLVATLNGTSYEQSEDVCMPAILEQMCRLKKKKTQSGRLQQFPDGMCFGMGFCRESCEFVLANDKGQVLAVIELSRELLDLVLDSEEVI